MFVFSSKRYKLLLLLLRLSFHNSQYIYCVGIPTRIVFVGLNVDISSRFGSNERANCHKNIAHT